MQGRHQVARLRVLLLDLPLFLKILIANSALVALATIAGYRVTRAYLEPAEASLTVLLWVVSVAVSVLLNSLILRAALSAIEPLRQTVEQVRSGNVGARWHRPLFGDPDLGRLGDTLNDLLDTVQTQRQELEEHLQQVRALSAQVIRAQEEERRRIALELHDEASQALTAIIVGHRVIEHLEDVEAIKHKSAELRTLTADTLDALHRLIIELRPSLLDDLGLLPALRWYMEEFRQRFDLTPELCAAGFDERLPLEVETVIYRIVQEALTNIARHAGASHVTVALSQQRAEIQVVIEDNGRGFSTETLLRDAVPSRRVGLVGMQERAALVGGRCRIASEPGHGTRVTVAIPDVWTADQSVEGAICGKDPLVARR